MTTYDMRLVKTTRRFYRYEAGNTDSIEKADQPIATVYVPISEIPDAAKAKVRIVVTGS